LKELLAKELRYESRTHEGVMSSLFLALLLNVLASLTIEPRPLLNSWLIPGLYWVIFCFSATLLLSRSFQADEEHGIIQGCLLAGISAEKLFLAKCLYHWIVLMFLGIANFIMISVFYDVSWLGESQQFLVVLGLAALGFSVLGSFCAALVRGSGMRHLLLPLIFYPLMLPLLLASTQGCHEILQESLSKGPILFLVANDLLLIGITSLLVSVVFEE
jgi:heme exporter protein B